MNFYNNIHPYYCGIDLHARSLYVCIIDQQGETLVHKEISANPKQLQNLLEPYIGSVVVGVECRHCWYWVADLCEEINVDLDMTILDCYAKELSKIDMSMDGRY